MSEEKVKQEIRLDAARHGRLLWRNNVGACKTADGRQIRYGLANDSAKMNDRIKSSDLIGITPRLITPEMVGTTVGVFTAIEVKRAGWKYTGDDREVAQWTFIQIVQQHGGIGCFAVGTSGLWELMK